MYYAVVFCNRRHQRIISNHNSHISPDYIVVAKFKCNKLFVENSNCDTLHFCQILFRFRIRRGRRRGQLLIISCLIKKKCSYFAGAHCMYPTTHQCTSRFFQSRKVSQRLLRRFAHTSRICQRAHTLPLCSLNLLPCLCRLKAKMQFSTLLRPTIYGINTSAVSVSFVRDILILVILLLHKLHT